MAISSDLAAIKVLCKNQRPTSESINHDLSPFLDELKSSPRFGTSLLNKLARRKKLRQLSLVLDALLLNRCDVNVFHYGVSISAFEKAEKWDRALLLLRQMDVVRVEPNTVTYSACISAMEKCGLWRQAVDLLAEMEYRRVEKNVITISAGISACSKAGHWWLALDVLDKMCKDQIDPDTVAFNACISSCSSQWQVALHLFQQMSGFKLQPDVISYSGAIAACEEGLQWETTLQLFTDLQSKEVHLDDFSYNALISSFSRGSAWQLCLHVLQLKQLASCASTASIASETNHSNEFEFATNDTNDTNDTTDICKLLVPSVPSVNFVKLVEGLDIFAVSATVSASLELQWAVGYPFLPAKEEQLTHGFYKYIAGMQALCARELLELVPHAQNIMDMFCGSGTVLVEALRTGKRAIGCDVSPLALLVATHHSDAARIDLYELFEVARELVASMEARNEGWHYLKSRISNLRSKNLRDALHFILLVSLSRVQDVTYLHSSSKVIKSSVPDHGLPPCMFLGVAQLYVARVRSLRARALESECEIYRCDARVLRLEPVDAIVTGPPYPGVYDYHSPANMCADLLGENILYDFCAPGYSIRGSKAPTNVEMAHEKSSTYAAGREIGQNRLWLEDSDFAEIWQSEQEAWLTSAFENLREGGTATLMIGDGDLHSAGDGGFDNLEPTIIAAEKVGFATIATATIRGKSKHPKQPKGMKRTEHVVHLKKPKL
eukprot:symbB.v1.2.027722.t1/scaffold2860.1/size68653/1